MPTLAAARVRSRSSKSVRGERPPGAKASAMLAAASAAITARMSFRDSLHALLFDGDAVWGFLGGAGARPRPDAAGRAARAPDRGATTGDRPRVHTRLHPADRRRRDRGGDPRARGVLPRPRRPLPRDPARARWPSPRSASSTTSAASGRARSCVGVALIALIPVVGYDVTFGHITLPLIGDHDIGGRRVPADDLLGRRCSRTWST